MKYVILNEDEFYNSPNLGMLFDSIHTCPKEYFDWSDNIRDHRTWEDFFLDYTKPKLIQIGINVQSYSMERKPGLFGNAHIFGFDDEKEALLFTLKFL